MRRTGKCPKCGSHNLLENARVIDRGDGKQDLEVAVYANPDALLFKGAHRGILTAWICADCGFTELYCPELF